MRKDVSWSGKDYGLGLVMIIFLVVFVINSDRLLSTGSGYVNGLMEGRIILDSKEVKRVEVKRELQKAGNVTGTVDKLVVHFEEGKEEIEVQNLEVKYGEDDKLVIENREDGEGVEREKKAFKILELTRENYEQYLKDFEDEFGRGANE